MGQPGIAKYIVSATPEFEDLEDPETFISTLTRLNVTDLLPNVTYEFRVQAVALSLDVKNPSLPSGPETITTATTGEIPMCNIHTAFGRIFAADQTRQLLVVYLWTTVSRVSISGGLKYPMLQRLHKTPRCGPALCDPGS